MFQQIMFVQSIFFILQPAGSPVLSSTCVSILARLTIITCFSSSPLARNTNHFISCSVFLTFSTTSFTGEAIIPATLFILEWLRLGEGLVGIASPFLHHHSHSRHLLKSPAYFFCILAQASSRWVQNQRGRHLVWPALVPVGHLRLLLQPPLPLLPLPRSVDRPHSVILILAHLVKLLICCLDDLMPPCCWISTPPQLLRPLLHHTPPLLLIQPSGSIPHSKIWLKCASSMQVLYNCSWFKFTQFVLDLRTFVAKSALSRLRALGGTFRPKLVGGGTKTFSRTGYLYTVERVEWVTMEREEWLLWYMGHTSMSQFHTRWWHFSRLIVTVDYDGVSTEIDDNHNDWVWYMAHTSMSQ